MLSVYDTLILKHNAES